MTLRDKVLLGPDYTKDENFRSSPTSNSNFLKDPSNVTPIELTNFMVAVKKREHLVNPFPFTVKKKKVKSQTVTSTLPQSQGPEALGLLPQKRKKPKSKKTPTKTKRNIQLAGTGFPSTLDEGTRKPKLLLEGTNTDPKDSGGNVQPVDKGFPSMVSDEGAAKTTPLPKGPHRDKDLEGLKPPIYMELHTNLVAGLLGTDLDTEALQLKTFADVQALLLSNDEMIQESDDEDVLEAEEDMDEHTQADEEEHYPNLKKYDNILPLIERQLVKASIEGYYEENVDHREQTDKLVQATMDSRVKTTTNRTKLLKALTGVTETLKARHFRYQIYDDKNLSGLQRSQPEPSVPQREGKGIATDDQPEQTKLVKASSIVCPNPDTLILLPYMINGKLFYLTEEQIQAYLDKDDQIKKAEEEAKRLAMTNTEVIKIVQEEAKNLELIQRKLLVQRQVKSLKRLRMLRYSSQSPSLMLKSILTPSLQYSLCTGIMKKWNFDVHNPFKFADFGFTELDEFGPIIQKKKNTIVKDLMTSLGKRKRKHMELEPEIKVPGLECNRSLPEAFQRWNDIHKVRVDSLVSYLVMASIIKTSENVRFCLKLRKLIAEHPDQEKLKSKRVKLEALGYKLD
ncbi:hypothetical protein Tco_0691163 [Tanacetum coccineum]